MVTSAAERKAVAQLVDAYGMSERRACKTIGSRRMTIRYAATRPDDSGLRERMKANRDPTARELQRCERFRFLLLGKAAQARR